MEGWHLRSEGRVVMVGNGGVVQVGGVLVMERFKCEEENYEVYAMGIRKPVEVLEDTSDMIS